MAIFVWSYPLPANSTPEPVVPVLLHASVNGDSSLTGHSARDSVARDSVGDSPLDDIPLSDVNGPSAIDSALLLREDGMCSISGSPVVSRLISSSSSDSIGISCGSLSCLGVDGAGIESPSSLPLPSSSSSSASGTVGSSRSTSTYPCWPLPNTNGFWPVRYWCSLAFTGLNLSSATQAGVPLHSTQTTFGLSKPMIRETVPIGQSGSTQDLQHHIPLR